MKLPLDPDSLLVDSFESGNSANLLEGSEPVADEGARSRYCSLHATCETCFTDCPCV